MAAKVLLKNTGNYAIIDDDDLERVEALSPWYENDSGYAMKKTRIKGKNVSIRMHAYINDTPKGLVTDHINGNRLDNRKSNLRCVSARINSWNADRQDRHTVYDLPFGVSFDKSRGKYVACKTVRKRFDTLEDAEKFVKQSERSIYGRHENRWR